MLSVTVSTTRKLASILGNILLHKVGCTECVTVAMVIYCCLVVSRTQLLQQPQDVANEGHASTQSEVVEVTEPIQGPLPLGINMLY